MNTVPAVGSRVRFAGNRVVGPCVGTVERIYRMYVHVCDGDDEECTLACLKTLAPESEWHVRMRPDVLPEPWAYVGNDVFAPGVDELERGDLEWCEMHGEYEAPCR